MSEIRLTAREVEVLALKARGLTSEEVGERLGVSAGTVGWHLKNAMSKAKTNSLLPTLLKCGMVTITERGKVRA